MGGSWEPVAQVLMTERYGRLLARARVLGVSADEAGDLVQEALLRTFSRRRDFADVAAAEQYVRRAIVTAFADEAGRLGRERTRWERAGQGRPAVVDDPSAQVVVSAEVMTALAALAPRVRACVVLRFLEDLSVRDTAAQLGLSEGAVKRYVSDGIAALNQSLGTHDTDDEPEHVQVRTEGGRR